MDSGKQSTEDVYSLLVQINQRIERIEAHLAAGNKTSGTGGGRSVPESFLPGGKDWFISSSIEDIKCLNRARGAADRKAAPKKRGGKRR